MAVRPFATTGGFINRLNETVVFDFSTDEISFSIGTGRASAKPEMRLASFLNLCEFIATFDPVEHDTSSGGVLGSIELSERKTPVDPDNADAGFIVDEIVSFHNPLTDRRVNIDRATADALFAPNIIGDHEAMIAKDDPIDAFLTTFAHVVKDATDKDSAVSDFTFKWSFAAHQRTIRVPTNQWDDFTSFLDRAYAYIRETSAVYKGEDWRTPEASANEDAPEVTED